MNTNSCPKCNSSWAGESIYDTFIKMKNEGDPYWKKFIDEEIYKKVITSYSFPYVWKRQIGIEDPFKYDGISYYQCPDCKTIFDRWTGEETTLKLNGTL